MTEPLPADTYRERVAHYEAVAAAEAVRSRSHSRARLIVALIVAVALGWLVQTGAWWAASAIGCGAVVFVWLVVRHDRVERRLDAARAMVALNREALARLARDWDALPSPWRPAVADDHPFAADLDVFGRASLTQVLGPVSTPTGRLALADALLQAVPRDPDDVRARQAAVRALAPELDFRQRLTALARHVPRTDTVAGTEVMHVLRWAEAPGGLGDRPWVTKAALVLAVATTGGAYGSLTGSFDGWWWLLTGTLGWALRWFVHEPLERCLAGASGEHGLRPWAPLIDLVATMPHGQGPLATARAALRGPSGDASRALRDLERLVALADARHSVWLYVPLQTLTLWDLHCWRAIERWRALHGRSVRGWLDAVGQVEALGALASLAFDQPGWAWPDVDRESTRIEAADLGHPLLSDRVRVGNDVGVGPPGRFLLITGSNMSGKSTLLRAIGLGVVLAQAGGPVCATRLRMPPLVLRTSMRVSDSLELGLSLFMASLVRLQRIVEAARQADPSHRVCYLLDEVLQGTNSAERQIAVRTIVGHLLRCEAIGAVTTHDLDLARDASFAAHADSVHLQETLTGRGDDVAMTFDYRLRPGPAQAGNALQLLRMLGLTEQ